MDCDLLRSAIAGESAEQGHRGRIRGKCRFLRFADGCAFRLYPKEQLAEPVWAVFLIFPILALAIGQFTGILLINSWLLLGLGAVLVVLDVLLMRGAAGNFTYEKLLK